MTDVLRRSQVLQMQPEGWAVMLGAIEAVYATGDLRQRFHVDVTVPPEQARSRISAALAAGGTLVTDQHAPAFTVLADPEGNKACICTSLGRD